MVKKFRRFLERIVLTLELKSPELFSMPSTNIIRTIFFFWVMCGMHTGKAFRSVDIRQLKKFASKFPRDCPLREVLLLERDWLTVDEFLPKLETWLNLLRMN